MTMFKKFKKIREYIYIWKICKTMEESSILKYIKLNKYKTKAYYDMLNGLISEEFYKNIFLGGRIGINYAEANIEKIKNYTVH